MMKNSFLLVLPFLPHSLISATKVNPFLGTKKQVPPQQCINPSTCDSDIAKDFKFCDDSLDIEERLDDLISRIPEEKIPFLLVNGNYYGDKHRDGENCAENAIPELGIYDHEYSICINNQDGA